MDTPPETFYFFRLIPPRPTFPLDMTAEERVAMGAHVAYWTENLNAGHAIVFGPVADPQGPWGLGVVKARDLDHMNQMKDNDPIMKADMGFRYEFLPMIRAVVKA